MSSETNKSSDTGSGKTINLFGGQLGTLKNQSPKVDFNSTPYSSDQAAQDSNHHVAARAYQETIAYGTQALHKQLHILLAKIKELADDFADIEAIVVAAEEAVQEATAAHPDLKRIAACIEALKQAAENRVGIAAPIAKMALDMVRLLEESF